MLKSVEVVVDALHGVIRRIGEEDWVGPNQGGKFCEAAVCVKTPRAKIENHAGVRPTEIIKICNDA